MSSRRNPGSSNGEKFHRIHRIHRVDVEKNRGQSLILPISFRGVNTLEIIFHARERMEERGITQEDVIRTLENPDEERQSTSVPGRQEAFWKKTARAKVKVVFEQKADRVRVFSTSWVSIPLRRR